MNCLDGKVMLHVKYFTKTDFPRYLPSEEECGHGG